MVSDETRSTLSVSDSLSLSDAGQYRCDVTILSQSISNTHDLTLQSRYISILMHNLKLLIDVLSNL